MRFLAALGAIGAGQRCAAIQAVPLMGSPVGAGLARARYDGARQHSPSDRGAKRVEIAHQIPLGREY